MDKNTRCKHGLLDGQCWTCKTGERIKGSGGGAGVFGMTAFEIGPYYRSGHDAKLWNKDEAKVKYPVRHIDASTYMMGS